MKLFLDLKNRRFVKSAASNVALDRLVLKRRDTLPIEVVYVENGAVATPPAGTTAAVGLKAKFSDANFLAYAAPGQTTLDLNTLPVEAAFSSNPASVSALLEIRWGAPGTAHRTATLAVELQNAVITGDEATPAAIPDGKATQAEAEAGTDNAKWMTPLRTAQAIEALAEPAYFGTTQPPAGSNYKFWVNTATGRQFALISGQWLETSGSSTGDLGGTGTGGGGVTSYNDLTDKPTLGTAAATAASDYATASQGAKADSASQPGHTHSIANTAGLQAALDAKQPAGSYAPATGIAPSAITGTAIINTDSRLSDSRTPLSHTHAIADVTDLSTSLASKISGTGVTAMQVVTSLPASPTPTTFYIVIPSGATTASAVTLGSVSLFTGTGGDGGGGDPQPTLWTPLGMTGLQRWYDAAEDSSITSSGGKVSQWLDKSGNNRHATQATAANQPTYFSSDAFGRKSIGNTTAAGLLGLDCPPATFKEVYLVGFYGTGQETVFAESASFFTGNENASNARRIVGNTTANSLVSTGNFTTVVFKNGGLTTTPVLPLPPSILRFVGAATSTSQTTYLLYSSLSSGRSFRGAFSEVLFFAADLDATNRQKVEGYLAHKWALAGNLPADHPYKSAAPTA